MRKFLIVLLFICSNISAQEMPVILSMKERAATIDKWLEKRIKIVLPQLMRREQIDMWIIAAREYNEDPVIETMLPATWLAARRRTVLIVYDPGPEKQLETLAVARYDVGTQFKRSWEPEKQEDQWQRVVEIITEKNPQKIAINKSAHFALADGLTSSEFDSFMRVLPGESHKKVVSAERLAIGWLETRTQSEMIVYQQICAIAHQVIREGFSSNVIHPGITTTDDLVWWFRERIRELKLVTWFHPSVSIQRADPESFDHLRTFSSRPDNNVIQPGDLLHVDFGITYLRLNTDTQEHAYVLRPGETDAPDYLKKAFEAGNKLQEIFTANFQTGKTGNEILSKSLKEAKDAALKATIYTHPIGFHGHAAGPTIGLWDQQGGVPVTGDYPLYPNTAYSIELNNAYYVEEWKKEIRIMLEEDAFFDGKTVKYINGRQKKLILIPGSAGTILGD
jgi:hypothetical protein